MRFSPDGQFVSFTHGYGGGPLSVRIVNAASGLTVTTLPAGHDPCWTGPRALLARSPDGVDRYHEQDGFACAYVGANDDDLDAAAGRAAFTPDRTVGVSVYTLGAVERTFPSTFEPALSVGGTLVLRDLASGELRLERLEDCTDAAGPPLGPGTRARWSSQTVVWDTVPFGRVLGRSSPDQPTVDLTVPGHACTCPVALWTGAALVVGMVLDDGNLTVCEWGTLQAQSGVGWPVAASGGSAFDWDLAVADGDRNLVRVAYLTAAGEISLALVDLAAPPKNLSDDVSPPDTPDPPDPPEPEPPEPLPEPEPEPLPPEDAVNVTYAELRNVEQRLEDTYWNHGHHPVTVYELHVNPEGWVWRSHYWDRRAEGMDHESAIRWVESQIDLIEGRPDRWAPPPPQPIEPGTLVGPIGVEGDHFTVPG